MKVLHVMPGMDPRNGGPAFAILGLGPAQVRAGAEVTVLTTFRDGDDPTMANLAETQGVRVVRVGPVTGPLCRHPRLRDIVLEQVTQAQIVHIHAMWEQLQHEAARAARIVGRPYLIRPCGMLDPWSLAQSRWKKWLLLRWRVYKNLRRAAALHFTANQEHELTRPLGLPTPAVVEPNGINLQELRPPAEDSGWLRHRFPNLPAGPVVVFLSRLHAKKGTDRLIDAFAQIYKSWQIENDGPAPGLVLAGPDEGGYRAILEAQAEKHGLGNAVVFAGLVTGQDKSNLLHQADLFCLPSHQENFGIAVVESLACGTPVLISDQVNIYREIVGADVGQAVSLDGADLADALGNWLRDPERRRRSGKAAIAWSRGRYDWDQIARRWVQKHYPQWVTPRS